MNGRRSWLVLAALCAALVVILVWLGARMKKLRAETAELRAKLAAAQVDVSRERLKPDAPASPDPELLRLRAEVAELRRQKAEVARGVPALRGRETATDIETPELPLEIRQRQDTQVLMRLVLAMHMIIVDREKGNAAGKLQIVGANGELTPEMRREIEKLLNESDETTEIDLDKAWRDIELLISDGAEIRKLDPNTIVARTVPMRMPNGKWKRVYAIADGSAHQRVHDTPDEVWQAPAQ
jgi:hypothetical protein